MHALYGALLVPYVPVRVPRGAVIAHWYPYVLSRCRTSQYCTTVILLSVSQWNDLADPVFDGVGTGGFQENGQCLVIRLDARSLLSFFRLLL